MKRILRFFAAVAMIGGAAALLAGCNPMLRGFYPGQTSNAVTFQITTNDSQVTNWSTQQVLASLYEGNSTYPIQTLGSGLVHSSSAGAYTASLTFKGLQDDSYYVLVWLDLNGDGVWESGEPYYLSPNFSLYGAQSLTTAVTVP